VLAMNDRVEAHRDSRIGGIFGEGALRVRTCTSGQSRTFAVAGDRRAPTKVAAIPPQSRLTSFNVIPYPRASDTTNLWCVSIPLFLPATSPLQSSLDALDSGSHKSALVTCNKLLKKHPKNDHLKVPVF
jgi:hypothetical protein